MYTVFEFNKKYFKKVKGSEPNLSRRPLNERGLDT
jgi:hypothetical protein